MSTTARWRIELFGGLSARPIDASGSPDGRRVVTQFRTHKTGLLLAYMACNRRRAHPRDVLIELFWPEDPPEGARRSLRQALSSLRQQLEPAGVRAGTVLVADRRTVQLDPHAVTTDVGEFEAAVAAATRTRGQDEHLRALVDAVERYHGQLLAGYYHEWVLSERERMAEVYFQALRTLIGRLEETGDRDRAVGYARRGIAHDPLREDPHRDLIRLLIASGEPVAAMRQYRELERLLRQELELAPSTATRALVASLSDVTPSTPPGLPGGSPAPSAGQDFPLGDPLLRLPTVPPTGTVTFLMTDVEGSTRLWEEWGDTFKEAMTYHRALLREEFRRYGGYEAKEAGDSFLVAFPSAGEALAAATAAQRALEGLALGAPGYPREALAAGTLPHAATGSGRGHPQGVPLRVRMALHTGDVELEGDGYRGLVLHHASRILGAAHGGQILCSEVTAELLRRTFQETGEADVQLRDLGLYRLRDVAAPHRLFQVDDPHQKPGEFPPLNAEDVSAGHLPLSVTAFFGREDEIGELVRLLRVFTTETRRHGEGHGGEQNDSSVSSSPCPPSLRGEIFLSGPRLITLTGPGGSGKTRLALEVARRLGDVWGDAAYFIPLADLTEAHSIPEAIREALRLPASPEIAPLDQVVAVLSHRPALLLLDNFEQLVDEGAPLVSELLQRVPRLACLVTSRHRLNVEGEREFHVLPLPTPVLGAWCSVLGEGRLSPLPNTEHRAPSTLMQYPSVQLFVDRAQSARPDFALTSLNAPAVATLCERLEGIPLAIELAAARALVLTPAQMLTQMERRFDFLVSRRRDAAARHRTLRAAIDWSYRLLSPGLQRFFARLSVFRGGWTLEAATAVCEAGEERFDAAGVSDGGRALGRALEYLEELRDGTLVLTEEVDGEMRFRMLETLREYARAQLAPEEWSAVQRRHAQHCAALVRQSCSYFHGPEVRRWADRLQREHENLRAALICLTEHGEARSALQLAGWMGEFWSFRGYLAEGREMLSQVLAMPDAFSHPRERAAALSWSGILALEQSDWVAARSFHAQSLEICRELGDRDGIARELHHLGRALANRDREAAHSLFQEALALWRALNALPGVAGALADLGSNALFRRDLEAARRYCEESLAISREQGDARTLSAVLSVFGELALIQGDHDTARSLFEESLAVSREIGHTSQTGFVLHLLGDIARFQGDLAAAESFLSESLHLGRVLGNPLHQAVCLNRLGLVAQERGDLAQACTLFTESLTIGRTLDHHQITWTALERLAGLTGRRGEHRRGARLLAAVAARRDAIGSRFPPRTSHDYNRSVAELQAALGKEAFAAAWAEGRTMTIEQALTEALAEEP